MDKVAFFLSFIFLVLVARAASQDPCKPDTVTCTNIGDSVPDMCDCSKFYVCLTAGGSDLSDTSFSCPPEAPYFDPNMGACGNDDSACPTTPPNSCPVTCTDTSVTGDKIVDPTDCTKYYLCDSTTPSQPIGPVSCETETPWFNGVDCVTDQGMCCAGSSALCEPYCTVGGVQIIDPLDCTKYYICLAEGTPSELYHTSCNPGENFDISSGHCDADAPCITLCVPSAGTTAPGSGGGTTTPGSGGSTSSGCSSSMECTAEGYFPVCPYCHPEYFYCSGSTGQAVIQTCDGDLVFNPIPGYAFCMLADNCPYDPALT